MRKQSSKRHSAEGMLNRLVAINFLMSLGGSVCDSFFSVYCQDVGVKGLLFGVTVGSYAVTKIVLSPVMGSLADRLPRPLLVHVALALCVVASLGYTVADSLPSILALRILHGMACAMFRPTVHAMVATHAPNSGQGRFMGCFDSAFYVGVCIGPLLGGFLVETLGVRSVFVIFALSAFAALFLTISLPRQKREDHERVKDSPLCHKPYTSISDRKRYLSLLLFLFGRAFGISTVCVFLPLMLYSTQRFNGVEAGLVLAASPCTMALLLRPAGRLADRFDPGSLMLAGGACVSLLYMVLPSAHELSQLFVIMAATGVCGAITQPAASVMLCQHSPGHLGASFGGLHGILNLGFAAGAVLGSVAQTSLGIGSTFVIAGMTGLLSLLGLAFPEEARTPSVQKHKPSV